MTVIPGECISTEEEYSAGKNTFAENGDIFADSCGKKAEDTRLKEISILKPKSIVPLKVGSIVFGKVMLVKQNSVVLSLLLHKDENSRQAMTHTSGMIPVRNVSRDYVKNLRDYFKIGDLVKAKVSAVSPMGIDLRTNEPDLGVVKAFCTNCRNRLGLFGRSLKCTECGNTEQRKVSSDYGV
ncbi:MAG: exosome complex RNA-binding protein Csl4 [Candidatus Diapherotrites archaeon]|nr:exosome complex RNA-binding protein Csl4 [Candidatus Diapherotrites archaeon]